jgi:hypothetical protein
VAVALDAVPPDPLESLPMMADELMARNERPGPTVGLASHELAGHHLPPTGEVTSPAAGTERS